MDKSFGTMLRQLPTNTSAHLCRHSQSGLPPSSDNLFRLQVRIARLFSGAEIRIRLTGGTTDGRVLSGIAAAAGESSRARLEIVPATRERARRRSSRDLVLK